MKCSNTILFVSFSCGVDIIHLILFLLHQNLELLGHFVLYYLAGLTSLVMIH